MDRHTLIDKKIWLRTRAALIFSAINVIGFEFGSLNISITGEITQHVLPRTEILQAFLSNNHWIVSTLETFFPPGFDYVTGAFRTTKYTIKLAVVLGLAFSLFYLIEMCDPFGRHSLLKHLADKTDRFRHVLFNELQFYAKTVPSLRLPTVCQSCTHSGPESDCRNQLSPETDSGRLMAAWNAIYGRLDQGLVTADQSVIYKCRHAYYLKYGMIVSIGLQATYYGFIRFVEWHLSKPVEPNHLHLLFIGVLAMIVVALTIINQVRDGNGTGAWTLYRAHVDIIFGRVSFLKAYVERVCRSSKNKCSFDRKRHG